MNPPLNPHKIFIKSSAAPKTDGLPAGKPVRFMLQFDAAALHELAGAVE